MSPPQYAQSTGSSNSDQWPIPNPLPRSKGGCTTCRRRKVKCDEQRPRCGHCTRLERHCDWERRYRFQELSGQIHEKYHTGGLSSPNAQVKSNKKWQEMIASRTSPDRLNHSLPYSEDPFSEETREREALTRDPGVCYVVHTPGTLSKQLENDETTQAQLSRQRFRQKMRFATRLDPAELIEETSKVCHNVDPITFSGNYSPPMIPPSPIETSIDLDYGVSDDDMYKHIALYEKEIFGRIMPFAAKFNIHLNQNNEDIVVAMSRDFPPLRHAICAVTLLSLGVRGQPQLMTGAFYHYQRAISACLQLQTSNIYSSEFFFTHYLLLIHDSCCMSHGWPHDTMLAAQHYIRLYEIARHQPRSTWSPLQISISWKLLIYDAQTCLAGSKEAGAYVRAFQANRSAFPDGTCKDTDIPAAADDDSARVCRLVYLLYQFIAELSQWATSMREACSENRITIPELEFQTHQFLGRAEYIMEDSCPNGQRRRICPQPGSMSRTLFDFVQLEYTGIRLYLRTSVYPGQRLHPNYDHEESARLCTFILSWMSDAVINRKTENYRLLPLFLAGCLTQIEEERNLAVELLRGMENSPVSFNARNSRRVLEVVHAEQRRAWMEGRRSEEVDWREYSQDSFTFFSL